MRQHGVCVPLNHPVANMKCLALYFFPSAAHVCIAPLVVTPLLPCTYSAVDGEREGLTKSDGSASSSTFSCHCEPCIPLCLSESQCMAMKF